MGSGVRFSIFTVIRTAVTPRRSSSIFFSIPPIALYKSISLYNPLPFVMSLCNAYMIVPQNSGGQ